MAKRTMNEIESDYKKIKALIDALPLTSTNEIAQKLGITESEVRTSLARHPRVEKRILEQLKKNKKTAKLNKKTQQKPESKEPQKSDNIKENLQNTNLYTGFVIDASIVDTEKWEEILTMIGVTKEKILLTSVTIHELAKLQKYHDEAAVAARRILAMAAENKEKFRPVIIDESVGIPDDCIVKFCIDNKSTVTLLTADKEMALKARMFGVQTEYFPHKKKFANQSAESITQKEEITSPIQSSSDAKNESTNPKTPSTTHKKDTFVPSPHTKKSNTSSNIKKPTLPHTQMIGNKLYIDEFHEGNQTIMVVSNNLEYTDGPLELKLGDRVYIAAKVLDYLTFHHYEVTSLTPQNNCDLVYFKRIYRKGDISSLRNCTYRRFMNDFMIRHDM